MKRVLITGGAGFLGSHLCDRFIREGFHVIAMDNLITGNMENIEHLFKLKQFEFYHHDVSKYVHVAGNLDYILHFASPASPIDYLKIPIQTLKVGSLGTHNILGLAKAKKARVIIASTSEVYGDPLVHGANVDEVRKGIGSDSRIGKRFLFAGIGYGGSCFPKDVQALAKTSKDYGYNFEILDAVMDVNEAQKTKLIPHVKAYFGGSLKGKRIAMWGLAFKPYTDDIREAPSLYNIEALLKEGASVIAYDAEGANNVKKLLGDKIEYAHDLYAAAEGADAIMIMTEWPEFRTPDFDRIDLLVNNKVIFDGRNLFEPDQMQELGYTYYSIGRNAVK